MGGGGSGYVRTGEFNVKPLEKIGITVGIGGAGSPFHPGMWNQSSKPGGTSSFGYYLNADGGKGSIGYNLSGTDGGSGGGSGCAWRCRSGEGGTDGSDGFQQQNGFTGHGFGKGQGSYNVQLRTFRHNILTPGAGGKGAVNHGSGGGGGGGVLLNNKAQLRETGV